MCALGLNPILSVPAPNSIKNGNILNGNHSDGDAPGWNTIRTAMGDTVRYATRMNLATMKPSKTICSTQYCLFSSTEYLVYAPNGGSFTVNLTEGSFVSEWFNTRTAQKSNGGTKTGGSQQSFQSPGSGDWVLYLKRN